MTTAGIEQPRTLILPPRGVAPRAARQLVRTVGTDAGFDARVVENAALVAGELVTDRISATRHRVSVTVEVRADGMAVRVLDVEIAQPWIRHTPSLRCERMLRRLTASWGYAAGDPARLETWLLVRTPAPRPDPVGAR